MNVWISAWIIQSQIIFTILVLHQKYEYQVDPDLHLVHLFLIRHCWIISIGVKCCVKSIDICSAKERSKWDRKILHNIMWKVMWKLCRIIYLSLDLNSISCLPHRSIVSEPFYFFRNYTTLALLAGMEFRLSGIIDYNKFKGNKRKELVGRNANFVLQVIQELE